MASGNNSIALIPVIGLVFYTASTPETSDKLEQPALEQHTQNVARDNDALTIVSAIGSYITNNSGNLPQTVKTDVATNTIELCGTNCDGSSVSISTLSYYRSKDIKSHTYIVDLKVPDVNSLYIVTDVACNDNKDGLTSSIQSQEISAAVLYMVKSGSGFQQKCVSL